MRRFLIILTIFFALTISARAQISDAPVVLVTAAENGKPTDALGGIVLDFGALYLVTYATNLDVRVNVPDRNGAIITTGTVTLRAGKKSFPASFAGFAPFFPGYFQINVPIKPDEFPWDEPAYFRVCDLAGRCKNSTGATVKR
jgi:hypothetical protein